ncbi:hypothetical protein E4U11_000196 [Claviceps purpurea]|nr:hypothetical protein E4U11_000196 [Claviceps purpurea]
MEIFWSPSDFQATATARVIASFRYLHEHELIICRDHGYASGGLERHLSQYHDYSRSSLATFRRSVAGLSRIIPHCRSLTGPPSRGWRPLERDLHGGLPRDTADTRSGRPRSKRRGAQSEDDQSDDGQQRPPRKAPRKANQSWERRTTHGENEFLREGLSIKELARPYLLTITNLPIKALDITGRNRPLDADHVTDLKNVFRRDGLERMAPGNRLLCLCTAADIQFGDTTWSNEQSKDIRHWSEAISSPIEVLAGQHRIAALRDYVTETESDPAELWWTCELYDRDTLPMHLNQSMRYNRTDPAMP